MTRKSPWFQLPPFLTPIASLLMLIIVSSDWLRYTQARAQMVSVSSGFFSEALSDLFSFCKITIQDVFIHFIMHAMSEQNSGDEQK